ncbi:MAG: hypothetical protein PVSMB6_00290 [Steroidobacteraceae bacterium]
MGSIRFHGCAAAICMALLALAACGRSAPDEMAWARSALERNNRIEIVATDPQGRSFTVRDKDTGELRMVRADALVGGAPTAVTGTAGADAAGAAQAAAASPPAATAATPAAQEPPASSAAGGGAWVSRETPGPSAAAQPMHPGAADGGSGRVLEAGPGYSIKAAAASFAAGGGRSREASVTGAALERRHEPIICQGSRMLQIDNRNLAFDGDAVSAEDGCEIHITNSHISASGVGVSARAANVHIDNSQIEGDAAAIDASQGAQVYAGSSRFRGMSRRLDTAAFHDLGGNVWN